MEAAATRMSNNILSAKKAPTANIKPPRILTNICCSTSSFWSDLKPT